MPTTPNTQTFEELKRAVHTLTQQREKREHIQKVIHPIASVIFFLLSVFYMCGIFELGAYVPELQQAWDSYLSLLGLQSKLTVQHFIYLSLALYIIPVAFAGLGALVASLTYKGSNVISKETPSVSAVKHLDEQRLCACISIDIRDGNHGILNTVLSILAALAAIGSLLLTFISNDTLSTYLETFLFGALFGGAIFFAIYRLLLALLSLPVCLFYHNNPNADKLHKQLTACKEELKAEEARVRKQQKEEKKQREEEARRLREQEAEKLYQQASSEDPANESLMKRAANLGSIPARLYMGRTLVYRQEDEPYTKDERRKMQKKAMDYLSVFEGTNNTEGEFLYLFAKTLHDENNDSSVWQKMLDQVRKIKTSGKLPEKYSEACDDLISRLVYEVDYAKTMAVVTWGSEDYARIAARSNELYNRWTGGSSNKSEDEYILMPRIDVSDM